MTRARRQLLAPRRRVPPGHRRPGFTLVEVVVSIALLGGVLLAFAGFTRNFVRASNGVALRAAASDLAVERLEAAKAATSYAAIDALAGTEATVPNTTPGYSGYARRTVVTQTRTAQVDYKTITVTVTHPALAASVNKTTAIAAF